MLNEDMAIDLAQESMNKHDTMYDAIQACLAMGVSPEKISAKSDYNIAWESSSGRFVLIDPANKQVMYPQSDDTYDIYDISGKEIDYFIVTTYDNRIEEDETFKYSVYAYGNDWPTELTIHAGFDAGDVKGFEKITFENDAERKDVIIRTNEFATILEVNGKLGAGLDGDNVKHYGYAAEVNVKSIGYASYHEFGTIGRLSVNKGHIVIEDYAEVFCLMEVAANAGDVNSTDVNLYATVYQGEIKTSKAHTENVSKCADGSHEYCKYVADDENVYDVCKYCGYTLVEEKAQNEPTPLGNVVSSSNSNDEEHVHSFTKEVKTAATCKKVGFYIFEDGSYYRVRCSILTESTPLQGYDSTKPNYNSLEGVISCRFKDITGSNLGDRFGYLDGPFKTCMFKVNNVNISSSTKLTNGMKITIEYLYED